MEEKYTSSSIKKYDIEIDNRLFSCRIFWAHVISSETQSLFTSNTKHTFYEIQYVLEGRIDMLIGENAHICLNRSEFSIVPPDTYHQIVDGDSTGARFIMAFDLRPKNNKTKLRLHGLDSLTVHRESRTMRPLLSLILEKNYHDDPLRKSLLNSLLESFLLEILEVVAPRQNTEAVLNKTAKNNHRIKHIQAFVTAYNGVGIHVCDIAQKFYLSERQLNRILKTAIGMSAKQLIEHEKMKKIEELAATTKLTFNEISKLCGFCDEYAMNKFFRRHSKTNLSEFRKISYQKTVK